MKEGQERPKIKVKLRQIDKVESEAFDGQSPPVQKITLHEKSEEIPTNETSPEKKHSVFQITALVLTILLVVAIFVQIAVMIWLKASTNDLKDKNSKLPPDDETCLIYQVNDFDDEFLINKV